MECKYEISVSFVMIFPELIDTLWNVNAFNINIVCFHIPN